MTSANAGEGKTTTVTNLAAVLTNMNHKVLLIDGDIRSPRLHSIFDLDNSLGLTTVLQQIARQRWLTIRCRFVTRPTPDL